MQLFMLKSVLSLIALLSAFFAMYTMLGIFGKDNGGDPEKLKRLHKINGLTYIALFLAVSVLCTYLMYRTKTEPSPRGALHALLSISVFSVLAVKLLFVKVYRKFYNQAKYLGITAVMLTFAMVGMSAGYYLIAGKAMPAALQKRMQPDRQPLLKKKFELKTDSASISTGKNLYESKCTVCHDPMSNKSIKGPGHKNILKNQVLPASRRPATPANIIIQLRRPYRNMPSFAYLSDDEVINIIAYLNTL